MGNAEHMLRISNPRAATVRSLTFDALDRGCILGGKRGVDSLLEMRDKRPMLEMRDKRPMADFGPQTEAKKPRPASLEEDETNLPQDTSSELRASLDDSDESESESETSSSTSSSSSSSSSASSAEPSKNPTDSKGTAETPIVIDEDDSESQLPLERYFDGGKGEEADRVTVKAEAILASKEAAAMELATAVRIPVSLESPREMHLVPSTCIETETYGAAMEYCMVKTEQAMGVTGGTVLSQDDDIVVGGTSVDV